MTASPSRFDPPDGSLRGRASAGAVQTGLAQVVKLAVQFGSVVVLSRLLSPADFGLIAMAGPLVGFAALFQDLGLTQAVVQKPQVTQAELSTLFALSLATGVALALLLVIASPLAARFYHEPRAGALTAAMGLNVVLGSAGALHYALLNRRMRFGALAAIDAVSAVGGLAVSVAFAWAHPSVWALYAGGLAAAAIPPLGYWWCADWTPSRPRRRSGAGAALRFGANVTGFNLANFFSRNLDNILIGRVWGERPLGLYDRAYKLLLLPLQQINNPLSKIAIPVLSRLAEEPERYRAAFLRTLSQALLVTMPGIAFMIGTSDVLIPTLLGAQWADAAPVFAMLGAAGLLQVLNNPTGWLFISQARARAYMLLGLFGAATAIAAFAAGLPYGPAGVAAAYAISEAVRTPAIWWLATRTGPVRRADIVQLALPHYAGAAASLAAVWAFRAAGPGVAATLAGGLCVSYAASILAIALFPRGRPVLGQTADLLRPLLARARAVIP